MNKSFSKIRHIQLSNILLEERIKKEKGLISEDVQSTTSPQAALSTLAGEIAPLLSSAEFPEISMETLSKLADEDESTISSVESASKDPEEPTIEKSEKSKLKDFLCSKTNQELASMLDKALEARRKRRAERKAKKQGKIEPTSTEPSTEMQEQGATVLNPGGPGPWKMILLGVGWLIVMLIVILAYRRKYTKGFGCPSFK